LKLAAFFEERAHQIGSKLLLQTAQLVAGDPFKTVKKMLKDLEFKLREQAAEEAEHHGFCQAELAKNNVVRQERTAEITDLRTQVEDLNNEIADLAQSIADLKTGISDLDKAMSEAAVDRANAKAENKDVIQEAKDSQASVDAAISCSRISMQSQLKPLP